MVPTFKSVGKSHSRAPVRAPGHSPSTVDQMLSDDLEFSVVCDVRRDELVSAFDAHTIAQALAARSHGVSA